MTEIQEVKGGGAFWNFWSLRGVWMKILPEVDCGYFF